MKRRLRSRGLAAFAGTMVVAGPVLAACVGEPTYEDWAATDGAAGRINLDDVQDAFKRSESPTEFEERVNRIYEGDGVVLIRSDQTGEGLILEGFEDLDGNGEISDSADDKLFSIVKKDDRNEMQGYGANGYYNRGFGGGDFLFTYLLISSLSGPRYYQTTPARATTVKSQRSSYRSSSSYRNQVSRNGSYFNKQKGFAGSSYSNAGRNLSSSRQTYQSTQKSSGSFKTSSTNVRSASRFGGSSRGGGLRGGGGAQMVVGYRRGK